MAARVLRSGGAENFVPFSSAWIYEDPNKVHEYAKSVQKEIDQLNHKADNIAQYAEALLQNTAIKNEWGHLTSSGIFLTAQQEIDKLNTQLKSEKNSTNIGKLKETLQIYHQEQVEAIHAFFTNQMASFSTELTLTDLAIAIEQYKPTAKDDISTLTKKAKGLVEATTALIDQQEKTNAGYQQTIIAAHAMLKKLEDHLSLIV